MRRAVGTVLVIACMAVGTHVADARQIRGGPRAFITVYGTLGQEFVDNAGSCAASGRFAVVQPGARVAILRVSGRTIGTATLTNPEWNRYHGSPIGCTLQFTMPDLPMASKYYVVIDPIGRLEATLAVGTMTRADVRDRRGAQFHLGMNPRTLMTATTTQPTPTNPPTISRAEFDALTDGMTYEAASTLIGGRGILTSESHLGGIHTVTYTWQGPSGGANAIVVFQENRLVTKAQAGL